MTRRPDIMALGFQEIVPLTAQQIVQTDPEKRCVLRRSSPSSSAVHHSGSQAYMGNKDIGHPGQTPEQAERICVPEDSTGILPIYIDMSID